MYDSDRSSVGTDVSTDVSTDISSDVVVPEAEKSEYDAQRDSATVTGALQPDQKPGGDATAYPRPAIADESIAEQPDAVKDQQGDRHYCPDCGKIAYVDEARALLQEQARLKSLRVPPAPSDVVHVHEDVPVGDLRAEGAAESPIATPPDSDAPVVHTKDAVAETE